MYNDISKKVSYCVTTVKNQHITFLNKNCIYVWWSVRQNLLFQNLSLYKENIMIWESKNNNNLRKVNEDTQLLCTDQKNRICIVCCSSENTLIQNKNFMCCQIWETNLYNIYIIIVAAVVAVKCVVQKSVLKDVNQREFHIWKIMMKRLKKWIVISLYKTKNYMLTSDKNLIYKSYLNNIKITCWQAIHCTMFFLIN